MEKISVIVPVYNAEVYLEKCIQSIISQTYENLEIILVNDGSRDGSGEICKKYAAKDDRIIFIEQGNEGPVQARKSGITYATGKFIGFVDADDYIDIDMYEKLFSIISSKEIDIVHSGWMEESVNKVPEEFKIEGDVCWNMEQYILNPKSEQMMSPSMCTKLYRSDLLKKCYAKMSRHQTLGEDWTLFALCMCEGAKIYSVSETYYHYTLRKNSLSHKKEKENYKAALGFCDSIKQVIQNYGLYDELEDQVNRFYNKQIIDALRKNIENKFSVQRFLLSDIKRYVGKNIVIYGAGEVGIDYYAQLSRYSECKIVAWVDQQDDKYHYDQYKVEKVEAIRDKEYDYIIIANNDKSVADNIKEKLFLLGVDVNKVVWTSPMLNG